jgi:hypothetical protein
MQCELPAGRGGGFGGWSCTSVATRAGSGRSCASSIRVASGLVKRAVPRPSGTVPEGLAGMAELRVLVPGGAGGRKPLLLRAYFFVFPTLRRTNDGMCDLGGNAQPQAQAGVAASNHRPLITLDP